MTALPKTCRTITADTPATTWEMRFCAVLSQHCNGYPALDHVAAWCADPMDPRLPAWVAAQIQPSSRWCDPQGLLEMAERLADRPVVPAAEGVVHWPRTAPFLRGVPLGP